MDRLNTTHLRIGAWQINPLAGQISRQGESVRLDARTLRLLLHLAERAGEVVSIDELLNQVWSGVIVTQDSVYQAVATLRRLLGDDARQPAYIATVPRLGYRLVAAVSWHEPDPEPAPLLPAAQHRSRRGVVWVAILCIALSGALAVSLQGTARRAGSSSAATTTKSIAVLPFRDLTSESMDQEYFADGLTEELIDNLSKLPGVKVASPASSFYFKDRHLRVQEIAAALGVRYLLDGSIRKSETTLRIAARLIRAGNGFVVWSASYDRPLNDKLAIQQDIAGRVTKVLQTTLD
jgi:TolB-like protein/DNA-binding winged helix-turn-helix (wHTH) protein